MNRRSFIGILSVVATFFGFKPASANDLKLVDDDAPSEKYGPYELIKTVDGLFYCNEKGVLIARISPAIYDHRKYNPGYMYVGYIQSVFDDPETPIVYHGRVLNRLEIVSMSVDLKNIAENIQRIRNEYLGHD